MLSQIVHRYPNGKVKSISYLKNGVLHHDFKPALSFYRNDINNTLQKECFYYEGQPSDIQEGKIVKWYYLKKDVK
jgi:antitoxin component YwqK of YwqJK toxin-antitoxin module